ncbi:MAG: hypothetical protein KY434_09575 [Actinobacteria bacterium]|nr:hypothetical protein [Actinomycetota bacterium]
MERPPDPGEAAPTTTSTGQLRLVYGITLAYFTTFGLFLAALQRFVTEELGLGEGAVGVAVGSFAVSALLVRPLIGRQIDRRGRRALLLGALGLHLAVALAFPLADAVHPSWSCASYREWATQRCTSP